MSRQRLFDHDEAYARWQAGETQKDIAASYGVTPGAVCQLIQRRDPEAHARLKERRNEWQRNRYRRPCIRGCGRMAWQHGGHEGVCAHCRGFDRATSVREAALRCSECGEWKPDEAFPRQQARVARRGRHSVCRGCQAAARARTRGAHRTPCLNCGTPRLADPRYRDSGYCRRCFLASRKRAA